MTTAKEYQLLKRSTRRISIRIDLINEQDIIISSLEGTTTGGNISIDSNSAYRRSGELQMVFDPKYNIFPKPDAKIWFGKKCAVNIGLKDYHEEITWFKIGTFLMDEVDISIDSAEKVLSCQLKDFMSLFDGTLGGTLSHKTVIKADDVTINQAIVSTIDGLSKYAMENIGIDGSTALVPYTLEKEPGSTIYDLITELMELYMGFDFYFNEDGYFLVEKVKDTLTDPIMETFDGTSKDFTINTSTKLKLSNVKNSIYVWGRQLDNGVKIKWVYKNRYSRDKIKSADAIDPETTTYRDDIVGMENGDICHVIENNTSYVWQGSWVALNFRVIPQFNIESIGEKIMTIDKDKIFTVEQAALQAEYELNNHSNFAETVSFNCVPLYHLKTNTKIAIYINEDINGEYLIDTISTPLDITASMSISCHKLYY